MLAVDPDGLDLRPLELGDSDVVQPGDRVLAIGNPTGSSADRGHRPDRGRRARAIEAPGGYVIDDVFADRRGDRAGHAPAARWSAPTGA